MLQIQGFPSCKYPVDFRRIGNKEITVHDAYCLCKPSLRTGVIFQFDEEPAGSIESFLGISIVVDRAGVLFEGVGIQLLGRDGFAKGRNLRNRAFVFGEPKSFEVYSPR